MFFDIFLYASMDFYSSNYQTSGTERPFITPLNPTPVMSAEQAAQHALLQRFQIEADRLEKERLRLAHPVNLSSPSFDSGPTISIAYTSSSYVSSVPQKPEHQTRATGYTSSYALSSVRRSEIQATQAASSALRTEVTPLAQTSAPTFYVPKVSTKSGEIVNGWFSPPDVNIYATYSFLCSLQTERLFDLSNQEDIGILSQFTHNRNPRTFAVSTTDDGFRVVRTSHVPKAFVKINDRNMAMHSNFIAERVTLLSICEALENFGFQPKISLTNDIFLNGKKVCGVGAYRETPLFSSLWRESVSFSLNVNVKTTDFPVSIEQLCTSMFEDSDIMWDRDQAFKCIQYHIWKNWQKVANTGGIDLDGLKYLRKEIGLRFLYLGEEVIFVVNKVERRGRFKGYFPVKYDDEYNVVHPGHINMVFEINGKDEKIKSGRIEKLSVCSRMMPVEKFTPTSECFVLNPNLDQYLRMIASNPPPSDAFNHWHIDGIDALGSFVLTEEAKDPERAGFRRVTQNDAYGNSGVSLTRRHSDPQVSLINDEMVRQTIISPSADAASDSNVSLTQHTDPVEAPLRDNNASAQPATKAQQSSSSPLVFTPELERTFTRETLNQIQAKIPVEYGIPTFSLNRVTNFPEAQWSTQSGKSYVKMARGEPRSFHSHMHVDHVRLKVNGQIIGRNGKVILNARPEVAEAHIPLEEWLNWDFFDNPGNVVHPSIQPISAASGSRISLTQHTDPDRAALRDSRTTVQATASGAQQSSSFAWLRRFFDKSSDVTSPPASSSEAAEGDASAAQESPPEQRDPRKPESPKESPLLTPEFEHLFPRKTLERIDRKVPRDHGEWKVNQKNNGIRCLTKHGQKDIRIDKGSPNAENPCHRVDHVRVNRKGEVVGRDGNIIKRINSQHKTADEPNAHIPLEEWLNWQFWFQP